MNDELGHSHGDELIRCAADILRQTTRESDVVVRLGGDEFGILAVECDETGVVALLHRLEPSFKESDVAASIGMSMWNASQDLGDTIERADRDMFERKVRRKEFFLARQDPQQRGDQSITRKKAKSVHWHLGFGKVIACLWDAVR